MAVGSSQLLLVGIGVLLLGLGFMFAHSSLLTTATQFAQKARGTAMSLVAFAFMVGGAIGTALGGRLIEAASYREFYLIGGVSLVALTLIALVAVPRQPVSEEGPVHLHHAHDGASEPGAQVSGPAVALVEVESGD